MIWQSEKIIFFSFYYFKDYSPNFLIKKVEIQLSFVFILKMGLTLRLARVMVSGQGGCRRGGGAWRPGALDGA